MSTTANSPGSLARLIERFDVAENTMAFRFERPDGFAFQPGQAMDITLPDPPETDAEGNRRTFSITNGPEEPGLMVATRMRDTAFKRVLKSWPAGSAVRIEGPFGNLVLHKNAARPAVILCGGIGITPFHSIVVHAAKASLPHRIFLFYSNRRPEDAAFLDELRALESENPNYKLIATMTEMPEARRAWRGETGHIDKEMLDRYLRGTPPGEGKTPIYYIAGPPGMVHGLQAMLSGAGADPDDVRIEEFFGY